MLAPIEISQRLFEYRNPVRCHSSIVAFYPLQLPCSQFFSRPTYLASICDDASHTRPTSKPIQRHDAPSPAAEPYPRMEEFTYLGLPRISPLCLGRDESFAERFVHVDVNGVHIKTQLKRQFTAEYGRENLFVTSKLLLLLFCHRYIFGHESGPNEVLHLTNHCANQESNSLIGPKYDVALIARKLGRASHRHDHESTPFSIEMYKAEIFGTTSFPLNKSHYVERTYEVITIAVHTISPYFPSEEGSRGQACTGHRRLTTLHRPPQQTDCRQSA